MRVLSTLLVGVLFASATSTAATAQSQYVRGTVQQSDTRAPVVGAIVLLLDEAGATQATILTTETGQFLLRVPEPGRYALRVQRIGFKDVFTGHFDVAAGQMVEQEVLAAPQAIVLQAITAEARRRCVTRPQEGLAIATLWGEARKALQAAAVTENESMYRLTVSRWERELDATSLRVRREATRSRVAYAEGSPFVSLPAERLLREGFVSIGDTASFYYAPDARVLLSEEFLDEYCLRIADQPDQPPHLVGLAFEPASRRGPAAVRGTLWIDQRTFQLQYLEYGYARVQLPDGPAGKVGGRVDFEALPNGTWIVRRWYIRMPVIENKATPWRAAGQRITPTIVALAEEGGEVTEVAASQNAARALRVATHSSLEGVVFDSASAIPLAGATVVIAGTEHSGTTDEQGRYRIANLPEGEYAVTFSHPRTALYRFEPGTSTVSVRRGSDVTVNLAIPEAARQRGVLAQCPADVELRAGASGVLRGRVVDEFTRTPIPGARVTLSWEEPDATGAAVTQTRSANAGTDGTYVACGVPEGVSLAARVAFNEFATNHAAVEGPGSAGIAEREFGLRMTQPQPVVVVLQDYENGRPIADAAVTLPELQLRAVTNRQGQVSFEAVPPGRHQIQVEHMAYGAHAREVEVGTTPERLEVRVPTRAIALQGIEVTVRSAVEESRRTRGVRVAVVDREEIARIEGAAEHVGHIAQRIPGVTMQEIYHPFSGLRSGMCVRVMRGATAGGERPCAVIFLNGIPLADTDILLALRPDALESVEFMNPVEAGPRYGTVAGQAGALLIWTRGNGPYARRGGTQQR